MCWLSRTGSEFALRHGQKRLHPRTQGFTALVGYHVDPFPAVEGHTEQTGSHYDLKALPNEIAILSPNNETTCRTL